MLTFLCCRCQETVGDCLSLCDILTDAVKGRIAGGNVASVKIPVATWNSKNRKNWTQITWFQNYPGVCVTQLQVQVHRTGQKITVLCFNDSTGLQWACPEPSLSLRMKNERKHCVSCQPVIITFLWLAPRLTKSVGDYLLICKYSNTFSAMKRAAWFERH